jgi:hypothetical protein
VLLGGSAHYAGAAEPSDEEARREAPISFSAEFKEVTQHKVTRSPTDPNALIVARDGLGGGGPVNAKWCGPRLLWFYYGFSEPRDEPRSAGHGGLLVDIESKKVWRYDGWRGEGDVINCTPDGEWLILRRKNPEDQGLILSRYHVPTRIRKDFLRVKGKYIWWPYGELSPDGSKILYDWSITRGETQTLDALPRVYRTEQAYSRPETVWLTDSMSMLAIHQRDPQDNKSDFVFNLVRYGDISTPERTVLQTPPAFTQNVLTGRSLRFLKVDHASRIYGLSAGKLYRCTINDRSLDCDAITPDMVSISSYDISSDGDHVIYYPDRRNSPGTADCIWYYYDVRAKQSRCLQIYGGLFAISPDGQSAAFAAKIENPNPPKPKGPELIPLGRWSSVLTVIRVRP